MLGGTRLNEENLRGYEAEGKEDVKALGGMIWEKTFPVGIL